MCMLCAVRFHLHTSACSYLLKVNGYIFAVRIIRFETSFDFRYSGSLLFVGLMILVVHLRFVI